MTPVVSVIVPAHDRATTLPRAIRSALNQSCNDLEVIVVDDGSTDNTPDVVRGLQDERVRFRRFDDQRGANVARNEGVDLARGQFVSFLDSDDELHPRHLERVLEMFRAEGAGCDGVFTSYQLVRGDAVVHVSSPEERYVTYREMLDDNAIGVFSCATFRAPIFEHVRPDPDLVCWQDYDFFLRALRRGHRIHGLKRTLVSCHESENGIGANLQRRVRGTRRFREKHRDELTGRGLAKLQYYRAFGYARAGRLRKAREAFAESIRQEPTRWLAYLHLVACLHPLIFSLLLKSKRSVSMLTISAAGRSWQGGIPSSS